MLAIGMIGEAAQNLDALSLFSYRVDLRLERAIALPPQQRSIVWRGAFGTAFRSLVCHDQALACDACSLRSACPFPRTFAPTIPEGRPEIARFRDPPRPFVLVDPHPEATILPAGATALGIVIVGTAVGDLPYFVVTLRRLGELGIGPARARFEVDSVRATDAAGLARDIVYQRGNHQVRPAHVALRARDLARPADVGAHRVRVRFVTPTEIRGDADSAASRAARFGSLVRRARDRASALCTFFGDGPLDHDPRTLGAAADQVVTVGDEIVTVNSMRTSSRTGQRHGIRGVLGWAIYEGPGVAQAMPWLRLAELLGVGKHASFGNGRIAVEVLG